MTELEIAARNHDYDMFLQRGKHRQVLEMLERLLSDAFDAIEIGYPDVALKRIKVARMNIAEAMK